MAHTIFGQGPGVIELKEYVWKNRLLLVFAPSEDDARYRGLERELRKHGDAILERDLLVFHVLENGVSRLGRSPIDTQSASLLRDRFSVNQGQFLVVLIGKDGGEKLRRGDEVDITEIFSLIDSMPMRQREMRERRGEKP
jgi:hypothetical protein